MRLAQVGILLAVVEVYHFDFCGKSCRQVFARRPVVKHGDADLVLGEDDVRPTASLRHPVAAPPRLEPVALPLHLDVGALALHSEGGAQVVERHQEVQPGLGLNVPIAVDRIRRGNWIQITRKARRVGDVPLRWGLDGVLVVDRGVFISLLPFVFLLPKKTQLDRKRLRIQESAEMTVSTSYGLDGVETCRGGIGLRLLLGEGARSGGQVDGDRLSRLLRISPRQE